MKTKNKMKQREIKFRAWDKKEKKMITEKFSVSFDGIPHDTIGHLGRNHKEGDIYEGKDVGIVIMQYTGLHDKRGKEIFEGDLIQTILKEPYVVRYDDSLGQFFGERKSREERETIKISGIAFNRYKVIGNICEHKK